MTFKALHYIARYMREVLFAEWYSQDKGMPHFRFIGGSDQIEYFRYGSGRAERHGRADDGWLQAG